MARRASFDARRVRLDLALKVVTSRLPEELSPEIEKRRLAQRARLLADVGISGRISDAEALSRLLPLYRALATDQKADLAVNLQIVGILERLGQRPAAAKLRESLRLQYPDHPLLRGAPR